MLASPRSSKRTLLLLAGILVLVALAHYPALYGEFTYDDLAFVKDNASVRSLSSALGHFLSPFPPEQGGRGLFRPLTAFSYALDHAFWGLSPVGFHLHNLIYYLLSLVLIFPVARRLTGSEDLALSTVLLFGLHPVHCEAVDSITGRSELLLLLFSLAAFLALLRYQERGRGPWLILLALVMQAAGMLSKESGVMIAALCWFTLWLGRPGAEPRGLRRFAPLIPFLLMVAGYMVLRVQALGGSTIPMDTVLGKSPPVDRLMTAGAIFLEYARLLVAPAELQTDIYYQHMVGIQRGATLPGLAGLTLLALLGVGMGLVLYRARQSRDTPVFGLALAGAWFVAFYLPVSQVVPFGALMAERLITAPSFAVLLALVLGSAHWIRGRSGRSRAALILLLLASGLFWTRSRLRAEEWQDTVRLWSALLPYAPKDYRVLNNLAMGYLERKEIGRSMVLLEQALEQKPSDPTMLANLAALLVQAGRLEQARVLLLRLTQVTPRDADIWNNLGVIAQRQGDLSRSCQYYSRASLINPNNATAKRNLSALGPVCRKGSSGRTGAAP